VVDIDPKVLDLAHRYFFLDRTPQIRTVAEDGRMFVRKSRDQYDCVVLDAFTIGGRIPFHLVTREFLALCRQRMTAHGVLVMNLNSAVRGPSARIFQSMYRTMASVFPNTYVFAVDHRQWGLERSMNVILVATQDKARLSPEQWAARARRYRSNCYVTGDRVRQMAGDLLVDLPDLRGAPLFSDDYAPIETMPF